MKDRLPLLVVGLVLLIGGAGSYVMQGASRGSFADVLSTYRSEPDGARGLFLLAQESGLPVSRVQTQLDIIDEGSQLVLLGVDFTDTEQKEVGGGFFDVLPDGGVAFSGKPDDEKDDDEDDPDREVQHRGMNRVLAHHARPKERERLLEHVRDGATLVLVPWGHHEHELLRALGVGLWRADPQLGMRTLVPAQPAPHVAGVERVEAKVHAFLGLPAGAVPLLVDDKLGETVAALVPHGQGEVVVVGAPELAMNKALARADNAQFWRALLGQVSTRGPVRFDEFHHGFTEDRSIADFAARFGLQFALAQLVLGVCLWALALRRFGRPQPPPEDARVGSTDVLLATSRLYQEGRHGGHAAQAVVRELCAAVAPHVGLRPRSTPGELAKALRARHEDALAQALEAVSATAAGASTDAQVLEVARAAAEVRARLDRKRLSPTRPAAHAARP